MKLFGQFILADYRLSLVMKFDCFHPLNMVSFLIAPNVGQGKTMLRIKMLGIPSSVTLCLSTI